jgi:hypothetical protein
MRPLSDARSTIGKQFHLHDRTAIHQLNLAIVLVIDRFSKTIRVLLTNRYRRYALSSSICGAARHASLDSFHCQCDDCECNDRLFLLPLIAKWSANHWFGRSLADRTRTRIHVSGARSIRDRRRGECDGRVVGGRSVSGRVSADLLDAVSRPRAADQSHNRRPLPAVYVQRTKTNVVKNIPWTVTQANGVDIP